MQRHFLLALTLFVLLLPTAQAGDKPSELDKLIDRYHELGLFNGSALVAQDGKPILRKGYGEANMEWHIPNTPDTRFRLGSISKQFTASLIMQLVEQGKIDLAAPITRYLPDYPKSNGDRITIRHLKWTPSSRPFFVINKLMVGGLKVLVCDGLRFEAAACIPALESTLRSHPCGALSSVRVSSL